MKRAIALASMALMLSCADDAEVDGVGVTADTVDDRTLRASYHSPDSDEPVPSLILLHQPGNGHDRQDFAQIWGALEERGYGLLAPDLRSHGESDGCGPIGDRADDPHGYATDLEVWLGVLAERAEDEGSLVDADRVGVVGLGLTGSISIAAVGKDLVGCGIALSPTIAEVNLHAEGFGDDDDSAEEFDDGVVRDDLELHDLLYLAGTEDAPSAGDVAIMLDASEDPSEVVLSETTAYGAELLGFSESNQLDLIEWCADKL